MTLSPGGRVRRGRLRVAVAAVLVSAWLVSLGALVQRDVIRTIEQRMADLALRVNPGAFYYAVERDGRHIGWASSVIDTLPDTSATFLTVRDAIAFDVVLGDSAHRATIRSDVVLTRGFALLSYSTDEDSGTGRRLMSGAMLNDTTIAYVDWAGLPSVDTLRATIEPLSLAPPLIPLASILRDRPSVGRRATLRAFGRGSWSASDVVTEISAESLFVVADSARLDNASGRWVVALRDTVRAWRVVSDGSAVIDGWYDAQGRLVEMMHPSGLRLRRMAFELAFENWRLAATTGEQ